MSQVLYEREKNGIKVSTIQETVEIPAVAGVPASEGQAAIPAQKAKKQITYTIQGTVDGQLVVEKAGKGYRDSIKLGRDTFKEVYAQYGPKEAPKTESVPTTAEAAQ